MKLCRCPICHSDLHLEALVEDEAGRELLHKILSLGECARPVSSYLGLFKPVKSTLANSRALKILNSLLEIYPPSNLLAHALSETVTQVRRNRQENGRIEPLANHNYLKKVYESCKPQFAVIRCDKPKNAESPQVDIDLKKSDAVEYIERMRNLGQLETVKNTESYKLWLQWKEEKLNATANT
ncbi:hypothetical protein [Conservatibacter flavescens]|uniref:Uncharacterized protein n=1 Tax=Conservatibacter flavescens TaxID=28161 RepID=A0A2M8S4X1_9PAST|nr:hypothetical protein [Conservatibacter flavescens]PJG86195.1 hypothetical protein CVP05_03220 [Conservatibacter flavescens]